MKVIKLVPISIAPLLNPINIIIVFAGNISIGVPLLLIRSTNCK